MIYEMLVLMLLLISEKERVNGAVILETTLNDV
jgi:hypothetical protein